MKNNKLLKKYHNALSERKEYEARVIATELGIPVDEEYFNPEIKEYRELEEITMDTLENNKKLDESKYNKIYITNQTTQEELLKYISNNAKNKKYSIVIFNEKPTFKDYVLAREDAFSYYNFNNPIEAEGVKEIYNSPIYHAKSQFSEELASIVQETKTKIKYYLLHSIKDKDGDIRSELVKLETKEIPKTECLDLIVEEGNFEKPGLLLPKRNYDWKTAITKKIKN